MVASIRPSGRPTASPVPVGDTTGVPVFGLFAFAPGGRLILAGGVNDGPSVIGGATQVGHSAIAVARVAAACPIVDSRPPVVTLKCAASCRHLPGDALDDPVGGGARRVLLGVERITGRPCALWNGRAFAPLPAARPRSACEPRLWCAASSVSRRSAQGISWCGRWPSTARAIARGPPCASLASRPAEQPAQQRRPPRLRRQPVLAQRQPALLAAASTHSVCAWRRRLASPSGAISECAVVACRW